MKNGRDVALKELGGRETCVCVCALPDVFGLVSRWWLRECRIKGAEARRRIIFFVNSLFVEQPKKRRVLEMPSLTTLTPYYNEDVVSMP